MITEDYVSFEIAKLLKEKGFDENTPVNYFVGDDKPRGCMVGEMIYHKRLEEDTHLIACPTLQMAMKWLREVHNIDIIVPPQFDNSKWTYSAIIFKLSVPCTEIRLNDNKDKKEQACEAAIRYTLENLI